MKTIYAFNYDCGRMGDIQGLFVEDSKEVKALEGKTIYFGEALGKHSDIDYDVDLNDFKIQSGDAGFVKQFIKILGEGTISGHNPVEYYREQVKDDDWDF